MLRSVGAGARATVPGHPVGSQQRLSLPRSTVILGSRLCEPGQPQPKQRHYVHRAYLEGFVDRPLRWETKPFRLWERILADNAKAEFIVAGIGKPREGGASYYLM